LGRGIDEYHQRTSAPFVLAGGEQVIDVADRRQTVRRCLWPSREVIEEVVVPLTTTGCHIDEINVAPSGAWFTTRRLSGQGEWGYDVFRTAPLARVGGLDQSRGYIPEAPRFAADESRIAVFAGRTLHWWWAEPDAETDAPAPGGYVNVGWLYFHRLPGLDETDHEVVVWLPAGWKPEDPDFLWQLPREVTPLGDGVRLVPSGGRPVEIPGPLPEVIVLPTPHPSGAGFL
jgi:hypothetical protein